MNNKQITKILTKLLKQEMERKKMLNMAQKWDFKKQEYEDYELPENCPLIPQNMEQIINCANCRKKVEFGDCYCSKTIHNNWGFGFPVCEECYNKELKNERIYQK